MEQMERAAVMYMDLLEGKDKPVAGSTCEFTLFMVVIQITVALSFSAVVQYLPF